jgi:hypothetical protein
MIEVLPGAGRAHQRDAAARLHREVDVPEGPAPPTPRSLGGVNPPGLAARCAEACAAPPGRSCENHTPSKLTRPAANPPALAGAGGPPARAPLGG